MLLVNGMIKDTELDDYEQGCIGERTTHDIGYSFEDETIEGLINKLIAFTGHEDAILNACEEPGRIDIQGLENSDAMPATPSEIEKWKVGAIKLWAVTYTMYVYECLPYTIKDGQEIYIQGEMK